MKPEIKLKILEDLDAGNISKEEAQALISKHSVSAPSPKKEEDGMSLLAQAGDMGLRALDYTSGVGRTAAMGLSDLARLTASGFDFDNFSPTSQVGDIERMAKGDAPGVEEMLDRSGVEEGIGRTATGLAGDILLDPATYLTAGVGAASKLGKLGTLLTAADKAMSVPVKVIGKGYKGLRGAAGKVAQEFSGANKNAIMEYAENPQLIKNISENADEFAGAFADKVDDAMTTRRSAIRSKYADLGGDQARVDITPIKNALDNEIATLGQKAQKKGGLNTEELDLLSSLNQIKEDAFYLKNADGSIAKEVPNMVNLEDATQIKRAFSEVGSGKKTIFDSATGSERTLKKVQSKKLKNFYAGINRQVDEAYGDGAKAARKEYEDLLKDQDFLRRNISEIDKATGQQKSFDFLNDYGRTKKGQKLKRSMEGVESRFKKYGSDVGTDDFSGKLQASQQMVDPSWLPISSNSVVSTGRIALTSAAGAALAPTGDTRTDAATGMVLGALLSSPRAMRGAFRMSRVPEKIIEKAPMSIWRQSAINTGRE